MLAQSDPGAAAHLMELAQLQVRERWERLRSMAGIA
jgi:hypothetical protein